MRFWSGFFLFLSNNICFNKLYIRLSHILEFNSQRVSRDDRKRERERERERERVPMIPKVYGTSGPTLGGVLNQNFRTVCPIPTA
jgi:hypothetical protein